ncbi:MAG: cupin domain-containing protein [Clostridiales Family XIII bacterium]|jgi:mannose-6-phosphate isomerase-like protein (cupin superfamily)|nr:cupin domain-containing protein [Clostridiales Family XIII bacterium]
MKKISISDVAPYAAPGHFGMTAFRLQGKDETGIRTFWMGKSFFLPGGGADWAYEENSPNEKVYYILSGEITVKSKDGTFVLKAGDSLYIGPNEGREMKNEEREVCEVLVVITYGAPPAEAPAGG